MTRTVRLQVACVAALMCGAAPRPIAQETGKPRSLYDRYTEPIPLTGGLGTFTRPISSTNAEAQAFFDQGFRLMYAFGKVEAVRSFREAWVQPVDALSARPPSCTSAPSLSSRL